MEFWLWMPQLFACTRARIKTQINRGLSPIIQRCHSARRITLGLLAIALMLDSSRNRCLSGHIPGRNKLSGVHSDCPSRFFSPLILCVFYCDGRSVTHLRS